MKVAYLLGWAGSGKSTTIRSLPEFQALEGDRFLKGVARAISPTLDGSWHEPRFWEGWAGDPGVDLAVAFAAAIRGTGIDPGALLVVEGTLFGWAEVIGPFHAALEVLAGRGLDWRRFYIEVDAPTVAARLNGRIAGGERSGEPVLVGEISGHLARYHERLASQGVFVAGRGDELAAAIRSYLAS